MKGNNIKKSKTDFTIFEKWLVGTAICFAIIGLIIFAISIYLFNYNEVYYTLQKINAEKFGNFGSFISGAVGTVWALVSVILFYMTLRLQRKELALQREELELTRNELEGQKVELAKANTFSAIQQFDSKFFQLIGLHNEIKNGINVENRNRTIFRMDKQVGLQFFQRLALLIAVHFYDFFKEESDKLGNEIYEQKLISLYQIAFHQYKSTLGHYFRNLFHIVRIVDENTLLDIKQKKDYIKILRAQLSQYEIVLLSYNGLASYGRQFFPLINRYELLKNIDFELLTAENEYSRIVNPEILIAKYEHLRLVYEEQKKFFENSSKENIRAGGLM